MTERRVGQRVPADDLEIVWHEPIQQRRSWFGRRQEPDAPVVVGVVEDVSATGAGIRVGTETELPVGSTVEISVGSATGTVVVRRVQRLEGPVTRYGVEYDALDPELQALLFARIERERPAHLRKRWERAD